MNTALETSDEWAVADGLADAINTLLDAEVARMDRQHDYDPMQILSGQLLAFIATMNGLPPNPPQFLARVRDAAMGALADMKAYHLAHPRA